MSTKRKKPSNSPPSRQHRKQDQPSDAAPDVPGETVEVPKTKDRDLSFRQRYAIPVMAVSSTISQASRNTGVAERTLRRWLDDPSFRSELIRARNESYDLARQQLQALMPKALAVLAEIAEDAPDPVLRLRAARYLMTYANSAHEIGMVRADMKDLNEAVAHTLNNRPVA